MVQGAARRTVLVVEDDECIRELLALWLRGDAYRVVESSNGSEALDLYSNPEDGVEFAIIDQSLPDMPGTAIADRLRAIHPGIKVVIVSGWDAATVGELAGNSVFLEKPFTSAQLSGAMEQLHAARSDRSDHSVWLVD
jgi:two-component system cell cycle sensor histidine kinase/response regulator CckA